MILFARSFKYFLALLLATTPLARAAAASSTTPAISSNNVIWTTLGRNENDSMPIGNGDLAANVWSEQNGDIVLLLAKSDAWSELGKLDKLGRVRIHLAPNPFVNSPDFTQVLHLEDGSIILTSGSNTVHIWVDANHPVFRVEANLAQPSILTASLELWRTDHPYDTPSPDSGTMFEFGQHSVPMDFTADTVAPALHNQLSWYHYNRASLYPLVLQHEHLESLLGKYPDPLLHRCFGAAISGPNLVTPDDHTLHSAIPARTLSLNITALTTTQTASPDDYLHQLTLLTNRTSAIPAAVALAAHRQWWHAFWQRSWIHLSGTADADRVSQGYAIQRYMMATSSRGAFPTKFNGGLFTVGHDMPANVVSTLANHNADFRSWGNSYWNQNNRLLYWPLLATGDYDLLRPWFAMYTNALPLATDRTRLYFHHAGAAFIETMYFWGLPNIRDFGWDNPTNQVESAYMRYHIQGALEVTLQMLDQYSLTGDAHFARTSLIPFADSILTFYAQHWPRDPNGKILMSPSQSIETYQLDAVNPTPDLAALLSILPRLLSLPSSLTTAAQRTAWRQLLADTPPIPLGTTAKGKLPPLGVGDSNGLPVILPAQKYGHTQNAENPELYPVFPYHLFGVGLPNLTLARNTFDARLFPQDVCWGQDGEESALLGLTAIAQKSAVAEFTHYGDQRFPWFWQTGHDWIPDLDNGGSGMMTLQLMLMQTGGGATNPVEARRIVLLPAWPSDWTADFKLHAPEQTTVQGHVEHGKLTGLIVTPASRAKDVILTPQ